MKTIRCGTPDCDWGFRTDLSEASLDACYSDFLKHCAQRHGLTTANADEHRMCLDLITWVLSLEKWK